MAKERFVESYRGARPEDLPWYDPDPDPDLLVLFDEVLPASGARVLDLGAGPAVHSIELAARGHRVVAIDGVAEARDMALTLAARRGVTLDYRVGDALHDGPEGPFDLVFDRGFLHTLEPAERRTWRAAVTRSLVRGGALILKCFDVRPPRDFGPPGLTARDVLHALGEPVMGGLALELLRRTAFGLNEAKDHAAWTVFARRL
ncbi:MAG TPA: class I SAM-dependent methyltransferase [Myxococcaceae bacterium]|nr:class I SAM-dependent methyltransferase [Myxococcaceae bacterium]